MEICCTFAYLNPCMLYQLLYCFTGLLYSMIEAKGYLLGRLIYRIVCFDTPGQLLINFEAISSKIHRREHETVYMEVLLVCYE